MEILSTITTTIISIYIGIQFVFWLLELIFVNLMVYINNAKIKKYLLMLAINRFELRIRKIDPGMSIKDLTISGVNNFQSKK